MLVGFIENATFIPSATLLSSSLRPLIPPTKSILSLVLGSSIASIGLRRFSCSIATSKLLTGSFES